jgi:hypothetical protein
MTRKSEGMHIGCWIFGSLRLLAMDVCFETSRPSLEADHLRLATRCILWKDLAYQLCYHHDGMSNQGPILSFVSSIDSLVTHHKATQSHCMFPQHTPACLQSALSRFIMPCQTVPGRISILLLAAPFDRMRCSAVSETAATNSFVVCRIRRPSWMSSLAMLVAERVASSLDKSIKATKARC